MHRHSITDTVLLSGWLFADLLLGLMMIFMISIPGAQPRPKVVPTLTVTPAVLTPTSPNCTGGKENPQCTVTVGESPASIGTMSWKASSDISDTIKFSPASTTLSPGQTVPVTISALPCQNGSFTFYGSNGASPVTVAWHCLPTQVRLDFKYKEFLLTVDPNGLLNNSQPAIDSVKRQVRGEAILQGRTVGLAVVYGGAPSDAEIAQAQSVATKVYSILAALGGEGFAFQRASYYVPLYSLGTSSNTVIINVYLFTQ